jgi:hypothetical protein
LVGPESKHGSGRNLATLAGTRTASTLLAEVLLEFGTESLKKWCQRSYPVMSIALLIFLDHTSSLLDCFALTALWLVLASLWTLSSFGLGMFELATEGLSE